MTSNTLISNYLVGKQEAHLELSIACLTYLSFDEFDQDPRMLDSMAYEKNLAFLRNNSLLAYAAVYWHQHE